MEALFLMDRFTCHLSWAIKMLQPVQLLIVVLGKRVMSITKVEILSTISNNNWNGISFSSNPQYRTIHHKLDK